MNNLREIAILVRRELRRGKFSQKLALDYQAYANVRDVKSFFNTARKIFPKLNCGIAAVRIKQLIPNSKIVKGKFNDFNHTFVVLNDTVIDVTADQYGGPEVYIGPFKPPWNIASTKP